MSTFESKPPPVDHLGRPHDLDELAGPVGGDGTSVDDAIVDVVETRLEAMVGPVTGLGAGRRIGRRVAGAVDDVVEAAADPRYRLLEEATNSNGHPPYGLIPGARLF